MAEPTPFLLPFFPPSEFFIFWGTSITITYTGTPEILPTTARRKYSTGSSPLTSSLKWSWHTHPSTSLHWWSLLSWHLLCSLLSCPFLLLRSASGPGSWPLTNSSICPLSPVFLPNERPPFFNFQKARWDDFVSYFDSHCPSAAEYSSLSSAAALFTYLALNAGKSSIPFGRIKRHPKAWWSAEVESAASERRKAFIAAHRSDEDRQAYISASRRASSVIAKAKADAWQTTCFCLSPKSNPKSVYSLLRSIAGSLSSFSFSPNFPNCPSPKGIGFCLRRLPEISFFRFLAKDPA